jgi:hypothetical protein
MPRAKTPRPPYTDGPQDRRPPYTYRSSGSELCPRATRLGGWHRLLGTLARPELQAPRPLEHTICLVRLNITSPRMTRSEVKAAGPPHNVQRNTFPMGAFPKALSLFNASTRNLLNVREPGQRYLYGVGGRFSCPDASFPESFSSNKFVTRKCGWSQVPRRACLSRTRGILDRQRASRPVLRYSGHMEMRPVTRADLKVYSVIWRETLGIQSCATLERACRVSAQTNL